MKICMLSYDVQEFGGLEKYAINLAVGLKQQGHDVSYMSAAWIFPTNQYLLRLKAQGIPVVQPPEWISKPASLWETKERILIVVMWLLSPITLCMGIGLSLLKRQGLKLSFNSAYNWLKGRIMERVIGPDRRKALAKLLLYWWNLRWRPDIFHIQGYTTSLLFAIEWLHDHNIPVVYEEHQTPDPQFNWWNGFEGSINKADRVIAVSEKSAQGLRDVCHVTRPIIVRGPLLSDPFQRGWQKEIKPFQVDKPFIFTTVARLYVTKGLTYLLDAAAIVKKKYPNVEFQVYGDGDLRDELLEKAGRLGLDGNSIFQGAFTDRSDLVRIMAGSDAFLLSSILEGQPLVIVEAMAFGCPIVSTAVGGIPELIQNGSNGLLCPPEDPQCLADKIIMLIEDFELRQRLSKAARAFYEQSPFQAEAISSHFISVYADVLKERNSNGAGE